MNAKHCDINFFIATLTRNNFKAIEINRLLVESWAADTVINVRRVQQIAKQYTEGQKERTSTCDNNIAIVRRAKNGSVIFLNTRLVSKEFKFLYFPKIMAVLY